MGAESTNLNMMEITVKPFLNEIALDLECGNYDPIIGLGASGVGKTESVHGIAIDRTEQGKRTGYRELRLLTMTEVDLMGIPVPDPEKQIMKWYHNGLLPDVSNGDPEEGILVFDEITSCNQNMRAAAFQLLDGKRAIGEYRLPDKWKIICIGNGPEDGGVFNGMENAFLNRCTCYRVSVTFDEWKEYAVRAGINPSVIAFLTKNSSDFFYTMNKDDMAQMFCSPRSWTLFSRRLTQREELARSQGKSAVLEQSDVELYAAGCVGALAAPQFGVFYSFNKQSIDIDDVLNNGNMPTREQLNKEEVVYIAISQTAKMFRDAYKQDPLSNNVFSPRISAKLLKITNNASKLLNIIADVSMDYGMTLYSELSNAGLKQLMFTYDSDHDTEHKEQFAPEFFTFFTRMGL